MQYFVIQEIYHNTINVKLNKIYIQQKGNVWFTIPHPAITIHQRLQLAV